MPQTTIELLESLLLEPELTEGRLDDLVSDRVSEDQ